MSVAEHISELRKKHESLSHLIEDQQRSPGVDELEIARLKRQKLRIKDEIARLTARAS